MAGWELRGVLVHLNDQNQIIVVLLTSNDSERKKLAQKRMLHKIARNVSSRSLIGPLSVLSVSDVGVLWPNDWTDKDETWHAGRLRPWPQPPSIFGPYLL